MGWPGGPLKAQEGARLLQLARLSLETWVREGRRIEPPQDLSAAMEQELGAFVTLRRANGELRGCIGHMIGEEPVCELILDLAILAGTEDRRFAAVKAEELPGLVYDISILSPMVRTDAAKVVPGRHGLYIKQGGSSGVLLPQVATEAGWDRETFLAHTCLKAGLPADAWQKPETKVLTFTAQVFKE